MSNETYVTSDLHFGHDNIISHCKRPCTVDGHTGWIMSIANDPVKPGDTVYHLGDFTCGRKIKFDYIKSLISQLNGSWKFIVGNHDNIEQLRLACKGTRHEVIGYYDSFKVNNTKIVLCHYPFETWDCKHYHAIHLHGHLHNSVPNTMRNRFNVGIDCAHRLYNLNEFV